jgi:hypothetical protein
MALLSEGTNISKETGERCEVKQVSRIMSLKLTGWINEAHTSKIRKFERQVDGLLIITHLEDEIIDFWIESIIVRHQTNLSAGKSSDENGQKLYQPDLHVLSQIVLKQLKQNRQAHQNFLLWRQLPCVLL